MINSLIASNICAPVLLNLLNLLQKRDKKLSKPHILSRFFNWFNKFNKTGALMLDYLYTIMQ